MKIGDTVLYKSNDPQGILAKILKVGKCTATIVTLCKKETMIVPQEDIIEKKYKVGDRVEVKVYIKHKPVFKKAVIIDIIEESHMPYVLTLDDLSFNGGYRRVDEKDLKPEEF